MGNGDKSWVEVSIEIPGQRDEDPLPVFLAGMLHEALVAGGGMVGRLVINRRWHWRVYIDVRCTLASPLSAPPLSLRSTPIP